MKTYQIIDDADKERSFFIDAENRDIAQESYFDLCESKGFVTGNLSVIAIY